MGNFLISIIVLFLIWDAAWWLLGVRPLFPWQLRKLSQTDAAPPVLLDVRTPMEYHWFHLPGAQNRPQVLRDSSSMPPVAPTQAVVVICMTGHRSPFVAHALQKRGYPQVYNLTWGMLGWQLYAWGLKLSGRPEPPEI